MLSVYRGILLRRCTPVWYEQPDAAYPLDKGVPHRRHGCPSPQAERKASRYAETTPRTHSRHPQDETAQQLKALQDENLKLRIEVAYLKELRRLRLQEEMQSKRQGSSAASEENFS